MKLNADFSQRVVIDTLTQPWVASPLPGVERRMLDRIGDEIARATSIVRYAPGSEFSPHRHGGGEEFLVLDGVFSDEHGDYGPGLYVRNPVGSSHRPSSLKGCTIFVKLWQMEPDDQAYVRIDTRDSALWQSSEQPGLSRLPLHRFQNETVLLLRCQPGCRFVLGDEFDNGAEILVLEGSVSDELGDYPKGTWLRSPAGLRQPYSEPGCTLYVKTLNTENTENTEGAEPQ